MACALAVGSTLLSAPVIASTSQPSGDPVPAASLFQEERARFSQALDALAEGKIKEFESLQRSLKGYPLHDYLESERLQWLWKQDKPSLKDIDLLNDFEQRTGDASLSRELTRTLQKRFADTEQWQTFLAISQSRFAASLPCDTLKAREELELLTGFDEEVTQLWVKPRQYGRECQAILENLESKNTPPVPEIWQRIYLSMEANKPEFAKPMLGYLASADRKLVKEWIESEKSPQTFLDSGLLDKDTLLNRRIILDLLVDWSRKDTQAAIERWLKIRKNYAFGAESAYDTHRALAMRAAYRRMPEAGQWLLDFEAQEDDLELLEWRIRTALLAENWEAVIQRILELPAVEREEDHWAYWEARALEKLGRASEARAIYARLASMQSYHGFLSADHLQQDYAIYEEPVPSNSELRALLEKNPTLVRAREFYYVSLGRESRREWSNWQTGKSEEELIAAALLAQAWGLYDRAINTAGLTDHRRAITLRFPVLYRSAVAQASMENSIEPAWIFGVMRRESAFIHDIRSGAGAIGLMQLMPRTAKYVAGLQGKKNWNGDLTDAATNIGFGTFYLRYVMDKFDDHQVLATAGYNAGPHRVDQWLQEGDMDADIWIDTIPYTETRRYVRAVMAYAAIYEYHLTGKSQRLSSKLRSVPSAPEA